MEMVIIMVQSAYIHIPFCTHICHYCDFNKFFIKNQPVEQYIDMLGMEMELMGLNKHHTPLRTLFIGGGTPTALSEKQLEQLMMLINAHIPLAEDCEFTVEANPGDLTRQKVKILKEGGVNRLSLGVQTFNEELLQKIGRSHKVSDVYETIELAKMQGFDNISVDLIYALPGQQLNDFKDTLSKAVALELPHLSSYSLIIEPKTVFYTLMNKGKLSLPGEDLEADMYEYVMNFLQQSGYHQYEISNYSKPGYESRHNLVYWDNEEYYGIGAGAHGYANGFRYANFGPLKKYVTLLEEGTRPILEQADVTKAQQMEEEMFLGLRKTAGISIPRFTERFNVSPKEVFGDKINQQKSLLLLEETENRLRLTKKGKLLGNEVFQSFLI